MSAYCEYCNIVIAEKRLVYAHNKTKKHIKKVLDIEKKKKEGLKKQFECVSCKITYSSKFSLQRHSLVCQHQQFQQKLIEKDNLIKEKNSEQKIIEKDNTIKENEHRKNIEILLTKLTNMEKVLNEKDKVLDERDKILTEKDNSLRLVQNTVDMLTKENQFHKELVVGMKSSDEKNVSALGFVVNNYSNAPCLTYKDDYFASLVNTEQAINTMISHFNKKTLHILIANAFVKEYKKQNPQDQSLWSTDVSRINFLVREFAKELDKNIWTVDKKGNKVTATTLAPLMSFIILTLDMNLKIYRETLFFCGVCSLLC